MLLFLRLLHTYFFTLICRPAAYSLLLFVIRHNYLSFIFYLSPCCVVIQQFSNYYIFDDTYYYYNTSALTSSSWSVKLKFVGMWCPSGSNIVFSNTFLVLLEKINLTPWMVFVWELYACLYRFAGMHTDLDIALGKISLVLANHGCTWRAFVSVQNLMRQCRDWSRRLTLVWG